MTSIFVPRCQAKRRNWKHGTNNLLCMLWVWLLKKRKMGYKLPFCCLTTFTENYKRTIQIPERRGTSTYHLFTPKLLHWVSGSVAGFCLLCIHSFICWFKPTTNYFIYNIWEIAFKRLSKIPQIKFLFVTLVYFSYLWLIYSSQKAEQVKLSLPFILQLPKL